MDLQATIGRHREGLRLFCLSFVILFLELALIRFTSAQVIYLGYFSNFILISVFLGIGLGFLLAERRLALFRLVPQLLLLLLAFVLVTQIDATYLREHLGQIFFGHKGSALQLPLWLSLGVLFAGTVLLFAGLAQEAARCFAAYRPIVAYSIDIGGSLAGILVFTLYSATGVGPLVWFGLAAGLVALLSLRHSVLNALAMGAGVLLLLAASAPTHYAEWSPYQRIEVWPMRSSTVARGYHVVANGVGHQTMQPVGEKEPIYDFPYTSVRARRGGKGYEDVLIIGSGSGTDVSYALRAGVQAVDAVEIDPEILRAGQLFHPAKPYDDRRVTVHVTDGRAFMEQTERTYDLIIFALPDSLAALSGFSNIRLESFLFTEQAFAQARRRLRPDGVLVLYNYYRKQWLAAKLGGMLRQVFGHPPWRMDYTDERGGLLVAFAVGPRLAGQAPVAAAPAPATDDWPFLYMRSPHLPPMYLLIMLLFVGSALLAVALTGHLRRGRLQENGAFALMGAAFLLLETKSIIQFLLLFGSTWIVNSLVFFAILASVLLANLVVHRRALPRPGLLFVPLFAALAVQYLLPLQQLLGIQSVALRYAVASVIFFLPIFCANLVFGFLFKDAPRAASCFGWNILGTMVGGALEYTSLAVGYRSLTLLVALLYAACFAWTLWTLRGRRAAT